MSRLEQFTTATGKFMCHIGLHRWGKKYATAGHHNFFFGMGHHAQNCERPGCRCVLRHMPS